MIIFEPILVCFHGALVWIPFSAVECFLTFLVRVDQFYFLVSKHRTFPLDFFTSLSAEMGLF